MPSPASFAASRSVNPPGATPVLTIDQLWQGLEKKERSPQLFIPSITACEIESDEGNKISRLVNFGPTHSVREVVEAHAPTIVYFEMASGERITNVVSHDATDGLLLTFAFANGLPPVGYAAGGEPLGLGELNKVLGGGVENTLRVVREMVKDGRIA